MNKIPVTGGAAVPIADEIGLLGADWGPDDTVVAAGSDGLWAMTASGDEMTQLTTLADREVAHYLPRFLPSGRAVLFYAWTSDGVGQLAVHDLDTGQRKNLSPGTSPQFAPTGHLVFWRDGALWAAPFDPESLDLLGEALPVVQEVEANNRGMALFMMSDTGTLLYRHGRAPAVTVRTLVWVDRQGNEEQVPLEPGPYGSVRLSPDNQQIAVQLNQGFTNTDLAVFDLRSERLSMLTFHPGTDSYPIWTPDGKRIVFQSDRESRPGVGNLFWKNADGTGQAEHLVTSEANQAPSSVSPDGTMLVIGHAREGTLIDIDIVSTDDYTVTPLLGSEANELYGQVSPDGRWIAYVTDETEPEQIVVRPFPNVDDGRWLITRDGGRDPMWSPTGQELIYRACWRSCESEEMWTAVDGRQRRFGLVRRCFWLSSASRFL